MSRKRGLLFLQLPALDNDVRGPRENLPLAGVCLKRALERSPAGRLFAPDFLPPEADDWDNATLAREICARRPAVLACTLYLWNIERTLRLLRRLRRERPELAVVVGGPEAAWSHPLLFRAGVAEAVAVGEGENVFPEILAALAAGRRTDFATVAWRQGRRYVWGRRTPPPVDLARQAPPADDAWLRPDGHGTAALETVRGCPLRCSFCRYPQLRRRLTWLPPAEVARRVAVLAERGAREIKFTDPTFNAHPQFAETLELLAAVNRERRVAFFAELRADTLRPEDAEWLARANFTEIEVGLQSSDPAVLEAIRRPGTPPRVREGVRRLTAQGIRVTLDVMYGLPRQTADDVYRSLEWGLGRRHVRVQGLQTLLLPGTALRREARRWRMEAARLPPYGVYATATLSRDDLRRIEEWIAATPGLPADSPAERYLGRRLPDLFAEQVAIPLTPAAPPVIGGRHNRRALVFAGPRLYERREGILAAIRAAVRREPDALWQFVLEPDEPEPLDLLDALHAELQRQLRRLLDRYAGTFLTGRLASRRVFVRLQRGRRYDRAWTAAVEAELRRRYY